MHYLDNASTTPVLPQAAAKATEAMNTFWANPSQQYNIGVAAEGLVAHTRKVIASALGAKPAEIYFTASGTEGNNIAVWGAALSRAGWGSHLVTTGYEHPSVMAAMQAIASRLGFSLTIVPPGLNGIVDIASIAAAVTPKTALVAAMHANNETGAIIDVARLAALVKEKNRRCAFHVDGVQAFCKLPIRLDKTQIDTYAVSGHKIGAPKGVGALYVRSGFAITPLMQGGGQEKNLRPGTENTAFIAALGAAAEIMTQPDNTTPALHRQLLSGLAQIPGIIINSPNNGISGIINISLPKVLGSNMVNYLAERSIYTSVGSACNGKNPSHTLSAMGFALEDAQRVLRVSFNRFNTPDDIDALCLHLAAGLRDLQKI